MSTATIELIQEREILTASVRVDRERSILRHVKLLGQTSSNGREYPPATITKAAALYEGVKVNLNHPKGSPNAARDYQDRLGSIRNVSVDNGLYGDLHFNPKHKLAEQLIWDATNAPENVGFSHNVEARTSRKDGRVIVEAILKVVSVDLVADPATTSGLYESTTESMTANGDSVLTLPELAKLLGMGPEHLRELADSGKIPCAKLSRGEFTDYLFSHKAVFAALSKLTGATDATNSTESLAAALRGQPAISEQETAAFVESLTGRRARSASQVSEGTEPIDKRSFADKIHGRRLVSESESADFVYRLTGRRPGRRTTQAVAERNLSPREFTQSLRQ